MKWHYSHMFREVSCSKMSISYYLETYGCSLNSADSDIIVGCLKEIGAHRVTDQTMADLIILNTCGVKEPTEDKIIHRLEDLATKTTPVVIAGCLPKISLKRIIKTIPEFAAIIGPQSIASLDEVIQRILNGERGITHLESSKVMKLRWLEGPPDSVICTIPICEGCLGNCSYCAVKFARGAVQSHLESDITSVVKRCSHTGYREIRLTSQDLGTYGVDINTNLVHLLRKLDLIEGQHMFRLGMFNPNLVKDTIDDILAVMQSDHFFKFFHIPLQSGSDKILQDMQRKYSVQDWEEIVQRIRLRLNDATIATDVIVGYPGESDDDFKMTLDLLQRVKPPIVNISKYGDRPGTLASKSREKVETSVKKDRSRILTKLVNRILLENNMSWLGWTGPVIVTDKGSRKGLLCRNPSYKPIIIFDEIPLGSIVSVKIIKAERTQLIGTVIH
ncbi:tRNA (N(6)-L-threonylcarbamoyladenosine(37)-C(2))-methylthiotransferase [Candidatus Thorarchaeota archaeon]|nr:MAG: tRNA (N(6)-L-threonylcarbamoyladenosine(37)-C(2))-methylthiotransferase [Candidatus Thorarchaeota archaeon]